MRNSFASGEAAMAMGGAEARAVVEGRLESEGPALVGQEAVTLSTTPAMIDGALVARPMVLRVFAARTGAGWTVMPGGYARIGRTEDPTALALRRGGSVADVWVVGEDGPVRTDTLGTKPGAPFLRRLPGVLPARAADNLYWLGRYSERAEVATRLGVDPASIDREQRDLDDVVRRAADPLGGARR